MPAGSGWRFIALNSLMVLDGRAAQRAALETLAAHLAPGGVAAVDVWLPDADDLARFDGRVILEWPRPDPETGDVVTKVGSGSARRGDRDGHADDDLRVGPAGAPARRWVRHDRLRLVSADELRTFAEDAGLVVELLAGGYDLGALGPGAERAVLIAVKP